MDPSEHKEREGTEEDVAAPAPSQNVSERVDERSMNMYKNYRTLQATMHMIGQVVHITTAKGDEFNGVLVSVSPAMDLAVAEAGQVLSPDGRTGTRSELMMIGRDDVLMVTAFGVDLQGSPEDIQSIGSGPDVAIQLPPYADSIHTQDGAASPMEASPENTIRPGAVPDPTAEDGAKISSPEAADISPGDGVTPGTTAEASPEGLSAKDPRAQQGDESPGTETLSAEASSGIAGASQGDASSRETSPEIPRGDQSPGTAETTSGEEAPGTQKASQGEKSSGTLESLERGVVPPGTAEVSQDDVLSQDNPKLSQGNESSGTAKASEGGALSPGTTEASQETEFPGTTEASQDTEFPGITEASQEAEFPGTTEASRDNAVSPRTTERSQEEADDVTCAADTSGASGEDRAFAVVTVATAQQTGVRRGSPPHQNVQMEVVQTTLAEDLVLQGTVLSKTKQNFMTLSNVTVLPSAGQSQVFDAILRMTIDVSKLLHVQRVSSQATSRMGRGRGPAPGDSPQARQEQNYAGTAAEDLRQAQGERRRGCPASEQLSPPHRAQRRGDSTNDSTNDDMIQELDQHHYADVAHGGDLIRIDIVQRLGRPDSHKTAPAMTGCGGGEGLASLPDDEPSEEFVMVDSEAGEGNAVLPEGDPHEDYKNMINELFAEDNTPDEDLPGGKDNALVIDCAVWPFTDPCGHFVHVKVDELEETTASAETDELDDTPASSQADSSACDDSLSVDNDADSSDSDSPPISNMGDTERVAYDDPESPEAASGEDFPILKEAAHAAQRFAGYAEVGHSAAVSQSSPQGDLGEMVYEPPEPLPQACSQAGQEPRMPEPDPDGLTAVAPDKEAAEDHVRGDVSPDRSGRGDDESQSSANFEQYMLRVQLINKRVKVRLAKALAFEGHLQSVDNENQMELTDVTVLPPGGRPPLAGVIPEMTLNGAVALAIEPIAEKNNDTGSDGKDAQRELEKFFDDSNDNEDTDFLLGSDGNVGWDPNEMLSMIPSNFTPDVLYQYTSPPLIFSSAAVRKEREARAERHALEILAGQGISPLEESLENE